MRELSITGNNGIAKAIVLLIDDTAEITVRKYEAEAHQSVTATSPIIDVKTVRTGPLRRRGRPVGSKNK